MLLIFDWYTNNIILQLTYFDRLQRQGLEYPREVPLTLVWNKSRVKERVDMEKRGYGRGIVLERMKVTIPEVDEGSSKKGEPTITVCAIINAFYINLKDIK